MAKRQGTRRGPPQLQEPAPNVRRRKKRDPNAIRPRPQPKSDPIKSMLLGALILGVLAAFFLMPVGGKTPFNHLLDAFGGDAPAQADAGAPASK